MSKKITGNILIVDDDKDILLTMRMVLKRTFTRLETASDPHQITQLLEDGQFDLVLLDMNFTAGFTSGKEGLRWLKKIRKLPDPPAVVLMTAYGEIDLAVRAMKEGAADFVVKPWDNEKLQETVVSAFYRRNQETPSDSGGREAVQAAGAGKAQAAASSIEPPVIVGESQRMQSVFDTLAKVAQTDANVLILGENGTGKELIARALHHQSLRAQGPFVHVDLGAISESLFESELFGHMKGAFTDAREDRAGRFEMASGGTLFLDEIGNLSLPLQAKLLSALQSRQVTRVGSNRLINIDIRLLCATNMPLYDMVQEKEFRQDLIYRINTVEILVPPLRERPEDIPLLVEHFMQAYSQKYQRPPLNIPSDTLHQLQQHPWPGNIRELQHALERAVIMGDVHVLPSGPPSAAASTPLSQDSPAYNLEEVEKAAIIKAIHKHKGNISKAAKELGLGRTTLYRKMSKYEI